MDCSGNPRLLAIGRHFLAVHDPLAVLSQHQVAFQGGCLKRPEGAVNLDLFITHTLGLKGRGGLHGRQGQQLHHVILKHVPENPCLLVIAGTMFNTHTFCSRNTDAFNISSIPNRLEDTVGESEHQHVLNSFFGQVVIDPEHLPLLKMYVDTLVQSQRRRQIVAKRFFHHQPGPAVSLLTFCGETGFSDHPGNRQV